jgi:hypothetical protein
MRYLLSAYCVVVTIALAPSDALAQSAIVDLSKLQPGTSRFVLNADMTPAALGVVAEPQKPTPAAVVSRVPACGEGCKLEQPRQARTNRPSEPEEIRSGSNRGGTVAVVGAPGSDTRKMQANKDRPVAVSAHTRKDGTQVSAHTRSAPSSGFRFRRR